MSSCVSGRHAVCLVQQTTPELEERERKEVREGRKVEGGGGRKRDGREVEGGRGMGGRWRWKEERQRGEGKGGERVEWREVESE